MNNAINQMLTYIGHRRLNVYPSEEIELAKLMSELAPEVKTIIENKFTCLVIKYNEEIKNMLEIRNNYPERFCEEWIKEARSRKLTHLSMEIDLLYIDLVFSNPYVIKYYGLFEEEKNE